MDSLNPNTASAEGEPARSLPADEADRTLPALTPAFFNHFADGLSDATIILDANLVICSYNRASEAIFGYPASLVLGKRINVLDRPMTLDTGEVLPLSRFPGVTALKSGRISEKIQINLTDSERAPRRVSISAYPWPAGTDATPTHVAVVISDITAMHALAQHADLLERVISQAADAILILDERGIVREVNPAFTRMTGIEPHEIIHGSLRLLEHPGQNHAVFDQLILALNQGDVWSNRIIHRTKHADGVDCIGTLSPLYIKGGRLVGFVYMLRDMFKVVEMEKRIMRSQKLEAIGTLAGGIAHDFNNLLHSIVGYTELAFNAEADPRVKNYLDNVLSACDRASGLVRQILTFSRREERTKHPVMLQTELEKAVKFIRVTLPTTADIETSIDCRDGAVLGDVTELHQVIINLLTNAFHALPGGVGKLGIHAHLIELTKNEGRTGSGLSFGPYVEIVITDTGKGIPPEIMDRIFEPFFTTKAVNEGSGLGLSIVHGIVTSMKGDILVESHVGQGTKFTLLLPLTKSDALNLPARPEVHRRGHERILIVDDEVIITDMMSEVLTSLGYTVTVENTPDRALARFSANPAGYDIIISDQTMPKMTGTQLAAQVRAIRPGVPFMLCTGNGDKELQEKAYAAGIHRLLSKPIRLSELTTIVRKSLDEAQDTASEPPADPDATTPLAD